MKTRAEGMKSPARELEGGVRISAGPDGVYVGAASIPGCVNLLVASEDGGVTLRREEAERVIAAMQAVLNAST